MEVLELAEPLTIDRIPIFHHRAGAGFPSPAADYVEGRLDFNRLLVRRPAATFGVRVVGCSMAGAGITDGGLVVVDRSERAVSGRVIVAILDGNLLVKRLRRARDGSVFLDSDPVPGQEDQYPPLSVGEGMQFEVWGCVTSAVTFVE